MSNMIGMNIWRGLLALSLIAFDYVSSKSIAGVCPKNQYFSQAIEDCANCASLCVKRTLECMDLCPGFNANNPKADTSVDGSQSWVAGVIVGVIVCLLILLLFVVMVAVRRRWFRYPFSAVANRQLLDNNVEMVNMLTEYREAVSVNVIAVSESHSEQSLPIEVQGDRANLEAIEQGLISELTNA